MYTALLIAHLIISATLIGLVLIQHGKGADAGAAFGSGASSTVFGARGSASFLSKVTALLAAGFFATSLALAMLAGGYRQPHSILEGGAGQGAAPAQQQQRGPAPSSQQPTSEAPPGLAPAPEAAPAPAPPPAGKPQ